MYNFCCEFLKTFFFCSSCSWNFWLEGDRAKLRCSFRRGIAFEDFPSLPSKLHQGCAVCLEVARHDRNKNLSAYVYGGTVAHQVYVDLDSVGRLVLSTSEYSEHPPPKAGTEHALLWKGLGPPRHTLPCS